jgi:hypothetical protein
MSVVHLNEFLYYCTCNLKNNKYLVIGFDCWVLIPEYLSFIEFLCLKSTSKALSKFLNSSHIISKYYLQTLQQYNLYIEKLNKSNLDIYTYHYMPNNKNYIKFCKGAYFRSGYWWGDFEKFIEEVDFFATSSNHLNWQTHFLPLHYIFENKPSNGEYGEIIYDIKNNKLYSNGSYESLINNNYDNDWYCCSYNFDYNDNKFEDNYDCDFETYMMKFLNTLDKFDKGELEYRIDTSWNQYIKMLNIQSFVTFDTREPLNWTETVFDEFANQIHQPLCNNLPFLDDYESEYDDFSISDFSKSRKKKINNFSKYRKKKKRY